MYRSIILFSLTKTKRCVMCFGDGGRSTGRWWIRGVRSREGGVVAEDVRFMFVELCMDTLGRCIFDRSRSTISSFDGLNLILHSKYLWEIVKREAPISTFA